MNNDYNVRGNIMQFKRSKGNFRETDRVVRFKLIKSGKLASSINGCPRPFAWCGASGGDHHANVQQDQIEVISITKAFLKGLITVGTVLVVLCLLRLLRRRM